MLTGRRFAAALSVALGLAGCTAPPEGGTNETRASAASQSGAEGSAAEAIDGGALDDEASATEAASRTSEEAAGEEPLPEWEQQAEALLAHPEPCDAAGNMAVTFSDELVEFVDEHELPPDARLAVFRSELEFYDALCAGDRADAEAILDGLRRFLADRM